MTALAVLMEVLLDILIFANIKIFLIPEDNSQTLFGPSWAHAVIWFHPIQSQTKRNIFWIMETNCLMYKQLIETNATAAIGPLWSDETSRAPSPLTACW